MFLSKHYWSFCWSDMSVILLIIFYKAFRSPLCVPTSRVVVVYNCKCPCCSKMVIFFSFSAFNFQVSNWSWISLLFSSFGFCTRRIWRFLAYFAITSQMPATDTIFHHCCLLMRLQCDFRATQINQLVNVPCQRSDMVYALKGIPQILHASDLRLCWGESGNCLCASSICFKI